MVPLARVNLLRVVILFSLLLSAIAHASPGFAMEPIVHPNTLPDMDLSVDPAVDFYRYANGGWLDRAVIPPDLPALDTMTMLDGQTRMQLVTLLDEATDDPAVLPGSDDWKAVRLYQQGIDLAHRDQDGMEPIQGILDDISAISDIEDLHTFLQSSIFQNVPGFFVVSPGPDVRGSSETIGYLSGPSLGLTYRDYYLAEDAASQPVQRSYIEASGRLLAHSGVEGVDPERAAELVFAFEARLAEATWPQEEALDFESVLVEASISDLEALYPAMEWSGYFAELDLQTDHLTLTEERYLGRLAGLIEETPLEVVKDYLALQLLWSSSSSLDQEAEDIAFAFYGGALNGMDTQAPIEGRVLDQVNLLFGDALGQMYVSTYFSAEDRAEGEALAHEIIAAYRGRIEANTWMTSATREAALAKLDAMQVKIGFPDSWDTYKEVTIGSSYFESALSAFTSSYRQNLATIGQPIDRTDWPFPPQTVNAMYNPANNEIVVPAAVLQAPLFHAEGDSASNLGSIGFLIGHEISHGFDVQGAQFDSHGVLNNWWTEEDAARFFELNGRVADQYNTLTVLGIHVDGERTLAENVADLGGIQVAYDALQAELSTAEGRALSGGNGLTPEQRFFISAASVWRSAIRDEALTAQLASDTHAPAAIRGVQPLRNCDAFYDAFDIGPGDPMYLAPEDRVVIW